MPRRGFVLVVVLFAVVLLSALVAGGFFAAFQELRSARNAQGAVRTRAAAEGTLAQLLGAWDVTRFDALAPGDATTAAATPFAGLAVQADVRRLDEHLFLLRADALDPGGAEQVVALVARLRGPETTPAAVRTRFVDPSLGVFASGVDTAPAGWTCAASADTVPDYLEQRGASDSAFFQLGPMDWTQLTSWAAALPPGGDSLPVRYVAGDLVLSGGRTLGLLVVEGNLTMRNLARHVGLIVVRGSLVLDGAGGLVSGAVVASQVIGINGFTATSPAIVYSSCSVLITSLSRGLPRPLQAVSQGGLF